jgi:hypothetical protein
VSENQRIWASNALTYKKSTVHDEASENSSVKNQEQVMAVPHGAPLEVSYGSDKFYIRACYDKYYHKIMDESFGKFDYFYISVTGTPGIGKSGKSPSKT